MKHLLLDSLSHGRFSSFWKDEFGKHLEDSFPASCLFLVSPNVVQIEFVPCVAFLQVHFYEMPTLLFPAIHKNFMNYI